MKVIPYDMHEENIEGYYPKFWFIENGKRYLFKSHGNDFSDIGEVFASFLYKELGIKNFVHYDFAKTKDGVEGTICEEYKPENQLDVCSAWQIIGENYLYHNPQKYFGKERDGLIKFDDQFATDIENDYYKGQCGQYENSVERMIKEIAEYAKRHKFIFDKNKIAEQLVNLSILDFFTMNKDRHLNNLLFQVVENRKDNYELKFMPLIDNGAIFGLFDSYDQVTSGRTEGTFTRLGITEEPSLTQNLDNHKYFGNGKQIIFDAVKYTKTHNSTKILLDKLTNLHMSKLINDFELENDIEIPVQVKDFMEKNYKTRLQVFKDYQKQNIRLNKKIKNL